MFLHLLYLTYENEQTSTLQIRVANFLCWQTSPTARVYKWDWQLTNPIEQIPSSEADNRSDNQEIFYHL